MTPPAATTPAAVAAAAEPPTADAALAAACAAVCVAVAAAATADAEFGLTAVEGTPETAEVQHFVKPFMVMDCCPAAQVFVVLAVAVLYDDHSPDEQD